MSLFERGRSEKGDESRSVLRAKEGGKREAYFSLSRRITTGGEGLCLLLRAAEV